MAVSLKNYRVNEPSEWLCLSSDTKPTPATHGKLKVYDTLLEEDTGIEFKYLGTSVGWNETSIAGATSISVNGPPGTLETRTALFDAEADGVAFAAGVLTIAAANLLTFTGFTTGKKRCRISYHVAEGGIPFVPFVLVSINAADDATAASRLSVTPTQENGTGTSDTRHRIISQQLNVIEYNLEGTDATVDRIDLAGVASNLTGTADSLVLIEVW